MDTNQYKNGQKHGIWVEPHEYLSCKTSRKYNHGLLEFETYVHCKNITDIWYKNGIIAKEILWWDSNKKQIHVEIDYRNGKRYRKQLWKPFMYHVPLLLIEHYSSKTDAFHGYYYHAYKDGTPMFEGHYFEGEKDGIWKEWWSNGNIKIEQSYSMGVKEGSCSTWREDGSISSKGVYSNGRPTGMFYIYDPDGTWKTVNL